MNFILLLLLPLTFSVHAADGKLSFLKGDVKINGVNALKKSEIFFGDTISVGKKSLAVLRINPNSVLKIKENSTVQIQVPKTSKGIREYSFLLKHGDIFIKAKSGKKRRYKVKVRDAIMGVRGTNFFVSSAKVKKNIWMCVNEGVVAVYFKSSPEKLILVKEGEGVVINSKNLPKVKQYSWTKELNWRNKGNFEEILDKTNIQNINYDLKNFNYE